MVSSCRGFHYGKLGGTIAARCSCCGVGRCDQVSLPAGAAFFAVVGRFVRARWPPVAAGLFFGDVMDWILMAIGFVVGILLGWTWGNANGRESGIEVGVLRERRRQRGIRQSTPPDRIRRGGGF
jgi:hypothetical protein